MIALALGGAVGVWNDLAAAQAILAGRPYLTIACNDAGAHYPGHLDTWVTLHPEQFHTWRQRRAKMGGNADYRTFTRLGGRSTTDAEIVSERWPGSSGLYMAQIGLDRLGATGVILCGVPLDPDQDHFHRPGAWTDAERYRQGFKAAAKVIGPHLRSMSGWTAQLLGTPSGEWLTQHSGL